MEIYLIIPFEDADDCLVRVTGPGVGIIQEGYTCPIGRECHGPGQGMGFEVKDGMVQYDDTRPFGRKE